jgi:hypothetical protein
LFSGAGNAISRHVDRGLREAEVVLRLQGRADVAESTTGRPLRQKEGVRTGGVGSRERARGQGVWRILRVWPQAWVVDLRLQILVSSVF